MKSILKYAHQGRVLQEYFDSRAAVQVIMGPLGSGKTTTSIAKLLDLICKQKANKKGERKSRWAVIRNSYPDLTNTTIRDWRQIIEPLRIGTLTMGHPPENRLDFDLPDRTRVLAEVIFLALDKDQDVRKLRGLQLTGAWFNEFREIPKSIFDMALGRIDRYPTPGSSEWVGIFGDTNAWDSDHWLEAIAEGKRQGGYKDYAVFVQPGAIKFVDGQWIVNAERENRQFLGEEYYRRQIEGKRIDWLKVNLANEIGYSIDGRAVHPDYSDTIHTARENLVPAKARVCHVGIDFGLTPAAAFTQKQSDGCWHVFDEIALEDGDATMLADEIKARLAKWNTDVEGLTWVFRGDPSGDNRAQSDSSTAFQVMRMVGVSVLPCTTNDPVLRRAALDRPLSRMVHGKPGIAISPSCKVLRKGLSGAFHYKRVEISGKEETYRDVPSKNFYSHVCEALEYALMDAGEHAIVNSASGATMMKPSIVVPQNWSPLDI